MFLKQPQGLDVTARGSGANMFDNEVGPEASAPRGGPSRVSGPPKLIIDIKRNQPRNEIT